MNTWPIDYLQRLIDGAFALLAGDADIQTMQPHHRRRDAADREPPALHPCRAYRGIPSARAHCWHANQG